MKPFHFWCCSHSTRAACLRRWKQQAGTESAFVRHVPPPVSPLCFVAVSLALHVALAIASNDNTVTLPESSQIEYPKARPSCHWQRVSECVCANVCACTHLPFAFYNHVALTTMPVFFVLCHCTEQQHDEIKVVHKHQTRSTEHRKKHFYLNVFNIQSSSVCYIKTGCFKSVSIHSLYDIYECVTCRTPWCVCFVFQPVFIFIWGDWYIFGDLCPSNPQEKKEKKQDGSKFLEQLTEEKIAQSGHWQIGGWHMSGKKKKKVSRRDDATFECSRQRPACLHREISSVWHSGCVRIHNNQVLVCMLICVCKSVCCVHVQNPKCF